MPSFATTTIPDLTGKLIDGRYKLTEVIGSGSFGVVYRAIDESVEAEDDDDPARAVAVKVVNKSNERLHDASHLRMEIALHKRASLLPRVVTLRAAHDDGEFAYLVMDLCRGGSLGQHVEAHGPYTDEARLRATFLAIVDAVRDLHRVASTTATSSPGTSYLGARTGRRCSWATSGSQRGARDTATSRARARTCPQVSPPTAPFFEFWAPRV